MTFHTYRHIKAWQKGLPDISNTNGVPLNSLGNGTRVNDQNKPVATSEGFVAFTGKSVKI